MRLNIVCFYADLGRPYTQLIQNMTSSAKQVMNCHTVLLTTTPKCMPEGVFDQVVEVPIERTTTQNICLNKVRSLFWYQQSSRDPTVYVDPDLEFKGPVEFGDFDLGVLWRKRKPDQPINTGMILAQPGCPQFWKKYLDVVTMMPPEIHPWWCDQLGLAVMAGIMHAAGDKFRVLDAEVKLLDMNKTCTSLDKIEGDVWAIHHKGQRKWNLRSGDGKLSPVSALSTDTGLVLS